jgi:hypothetical protein
VTGLFPVNSERAFGGLPAEVWLRVGGPGPGPGGMILSVSVTRLAWVGRFRMAWAQGGVSESPDDTVAPVQSEWRCSRGLLRRSSRRARGVQLQCGVTGARRSPGHRPAGGSVQRVVHRAWQWRAGVG